jgi:ABC-type bacteriocin/lantibiotic exporter with double-glycine peptidase domain
MKFLENSLKRRLLIPEVVQTSMMDCGPAALKAMLEGWGIHISYGRLREACQTDVDGTSIDTMEEVGAQLGLAAEQIMLPADHLLLSAAQALPAIVVVRHASGVTHFLIAWRTHGPFIQLMDPAIGRRWVTRRQFLDELYIHQLPVPAAQWREWAGSKEFLEPLRERLSQLKLSRSTRERLLKTALDDAGWHSLAALDAATRLVAAITRSGGISHGTQAALALEAFFINAQQESPEAAITIPPAYWSVRPDESGTDEEQLLLRGAVLVRVRGARAVRAGDISGDGVDGPPLAPELVAALKERPLRPLRELFRVFRADGLLTPAILIFALALAAAGVIVEALLLRGLLDVGRELVLSWQRIAALVFLLLFSTALLLLDIPLVNIAMNLGRRLELRLHVAFLEKLPRLSDRYFQSRLTSDMAERGHSIHKIRFLPELGSQFLRASFTLVFTVAAIAWLNPPSALLVLLAATIAIAVPLIAHPILSERDLRVRTHAGALSRFYLDAFQGIIPIRTHSAEKAIRSEHEGLIVEWTRAGLALQRGVVTVEAIQSLAGFGFAAWLSYSYLKGEGMLGGAVLLIYWALSLPILGQEIAALARMYPVYRNITLRILEPIGAIEETSPSESEISELPAAQTECSTKTCGGASLALSEVSVRAGGHTILEEIDLVINGGSHVAIVGPSGAGKSSLVGLLLGWHKPATGSVLVDGLALEGRRLEKLRLETAWIDPTVQLWNRPLIENLHYGVRASSRLSIGEVIEAADLGNLLERLPDGLQTSLGEGGALISGGEGQRVRLGRAMLRPQVRLAILDEPFRGLDRERRRELLARTRQVWRGATMLCITHDVSETLSFERVLVVEGGRIVEDGAPLELARRSGSRYRSLLEAEEAVREGLWAGVAWRRLRLEKGCLSETRRNGEG